MKQKLSLLTIVGLFACAVAAMAQTNTPVAETPAATTSATPAATPTQPGAIIPIIIMDDVPLTDAIKNLARQAGLNYMLDPKIAYGQVGADGKIIAQPSVSVRWENVTAEQALYALLNNYSLQLVEDPKSHISRVTPRDPAAPDPLVTKVVQLKYASPTNILLAISNALPDRRSKVIADVRTSQLVLVGTEKELADIDKLVERLDAATRQVLIEARLLETSLNPKTAKGIDWSETLSAQHVSYGNGVASGNTTTAIPGTPTSTTLPGGRTVTTTPSSTSSTLLNTVLGSAGVSANTASGLTPNIGFLNADGVKAVLSFINQDASAKVISAPRTVTLDNEASRIEVTRASPIFNVTAGTANTTGGSQITYTNLGVILNVTPRISANSFVNLKVIPEVSRIFDTVTRAVGGGIAGTTQLLQADEYDIRKMETRVMIPSGNTLVLGGLVQDNLSKQSTKVPVLGDVPGFGGLFRSDAKSRAQSNLLIFITPTIVTDDDYQPTKSEFLKTVPPASDSLSGEWNAWDSTTPYDWSAPAKKP
jgi:type II secretory pathway component GspD/PulD (secretin)